MWGCALFPVDSLVFFRCLHIPISFGSCRGECCFGELLSHHLTLCLMLKEAWLEALPCHPSVPHLTFIPTFTSSPPSSPQPSHPASSSPSRSPSPHRTFILTSTPSRASPRLRPHLTSILRSPALSHPHLRTFSSPHLSPCRSPSPHLPLAASAAPPRRVARRFPPAARAQGGLDRSGRTDRDGTGR